MSLTRDFRETVQVRIDRDPTFRPGSHFHPLIGDRAGRYSVRLTANVRITFGWDGEGAVDIEDYH